MGKVKVLCMAAATVITLLLLFAGAQLGSAGARFFVLHHEQWWWTPLWTSVWVPLMCAGIFAGTGQARRNSSNPVPLRLRRFRSIR